MRRILTLTVAIVICFAQQLKAQELIANWKFNEGANTIAHDETGDYDATTEDLQWDSNPAEGDYAGNFNNGGARAHCGTIVLDNKFTITGWFKAYGTGDRMVICNTARVDPDGFALFYNAVDVNTGTLKLRTGDGSSYTDAVSSNIWTRGAWLHFAVVIDKDAGTCQIYCDGVDATSSNSLHSSFKTNTAITIGHDNTSTAAYGYIDDLRIYSGGLNSTQISQVYALEDLDLGGGEITDALDVTSSISFDATASSQTIDVTSNVGWEVTAYPSFVSSVEPTTGAPNQDFTVTTIENTSSTSNTGQITITGGSITKTISVTQLGVASSLTAPTTLQFGSGVESKSVTVTANVSWTATVNESWLSPQNESGEGTKTITFSTTEANTTGIARPATITITGTGVPVHTIQITQAAQGVTDIQAQTQLNALDTYVWNATDEPKIFNDKLQLSFVRSDEGFPQYGTVIAGVGYSTSQDGGAFQLYFPYGEQHGGISPKVRLGKYNNQGWSNWETLYTTANANKSSIDWNAKSLFVNDRIGIGTTPNETLHVNGGALFNVGEGLHITSDFNYYGTNLDARLIRLVDQNGTNGSVDGGLTFEAYTKTDDVAKNILTLRGSGNVGIGCTSPDAKLTVNGNIKATKVEITETVPCSDYVFENDYNLRTLEEVETFVQENKHLPEVPSAAEFRENGYSIGEMDDILLRKVEELTLYIIEQQKLIEELKGEVDELKKTN